MTNGPLPLEITMLAWSCVLVLVQLVLQASTGVSWGVPYLMGPRDEQKPVDGLMARRVNRAFHNIMETFAVFVAVVLAVVATGHLSATTALGAQLYFWGRVAYLPLYVFGIPVARTLAWTVSIIGIVLVLSGLFH